MKWMVLIWMPVCGLLQWGWSQPEKVLMHSDRATPSVIVDPLFQPEAGAEGEKAAWAYIHQNWQRFSLQPGGSNLSFNRVQKSLLGAHYYFGQMLNGIPVEGAELVVSLAAKDGRIFKVANNTYPVDKPVAPRHKYRLSQDDALDVSWNYLGVHGSLRGLPEAREVYLPRDGGFVLAYRVSLSVDAPFGAWSLAVDALDGRVLSVRDRLIHEGSAHRPKTAAEAETPPVTDRRLEVLEFKRRLKLERERRVNRVTKRAQGSALVFDPDPRTTLMDESLEDNSPAAAFTDAYQTRPLLDITQDMNSGMFELLGPWCEIRTLNSSFTGPNTPVSTTTDGVWNFLRGNNAFNDANTYFHIDQNQRYIQSLGFVGDTGIQQGPISVDTDGANGQDNSFYDPSVNILAFGHGQVDDNEDADVILHEYGHALQTSINPFFGGGGDELAIGEGFGDYWASTYSFKTPNGKIFRPEWMFTWDGHGQFSWPGRRVDVLHAIYEPGRRYEDHEDLGGYESDELWSTPLFQAMNELYWQGIPIEEADRIVIESHFGLVFGTNMPTMATATVTAARNLYPDGPHAQVFQNSFARHRILSPVEEYQYIAAHVPPSGSEFDWTNEIQLFNPNGATANITATVYQEGASPTQYDVLSSDPISLNAHTVGSFFPGGAGQRWVLFQSDQPLAGAGFFMRSPEGDLGQEIAGIPLMGDGETATSIIYPHVPSDRANFWSGAVLLNPGNTPVDLDIQLIGLNGNDLSHLLSPSTPTTLEAHQKLVTFLAPGPNGEPGMFDDSGSAELVSYVKVSGTGPIAGFELYGYRGITGEVATAGVLAQPDQSRTHWPLRVGLSDVDWSGFSILNPTGGAANLNIKVLDKDGALLAELPSYNLPARSKALGLNQVGTGFRFPSNGAAQINLPAGAQAQTVLVTAAEPLRIFELAGDNDNAKLDGAAVTGLTSQVAFPFPVGRLEVFKTGMAGDVVVTTRRTGQAPEINTHALDANETLILDISGENVESVTLEGSQFFASLVTDALAGRSLSIVNGKQVEFNPEVN